MSQNIRHVEKPSGHSHILPPTPHRHPQSQPSRGVLPDLIPRNDLEAAVKKAAPDHYRDFFMTDDQLDAYLGVTRCSFEDRAAARKVHDDQANQRLKMRGGSVRSSGFKPLSGDPIHVVEIPNSPMRIRMWDGGVADQGLFLLDFVITDSDGKLKAVNSKGRFAIYSIYRPGIPYFPERVISWEEAYGWSPDEIFPGAEKFSVLEASRYMIKREGQPDFVFEAPGRERPHLLNTSNPVGEAVLHNPPTH
ncbi:hypothetical protein DENSPDRAFT_558753 [Dentipellis sp. KUC8613]|nr:hypothetical protein DENSPDRAFT_558753 [Dentipellis sp. KUC8613]